jgi:hypothetical protein
VLLLQFVHRCWLDVAVLNAVTHVAVLNAAMLLCILYTHYTHAQGCLLYGAPLQTGLAVQGQQSLQALLSPHLQAPCLCLHLTAAALAQCHPSRPHPSI